MKRLLLILVLFALVAHAAAQENSIDHREHRDVSQRS